MDLLQRTLRSIEPADPVIRQSARTRQDSLIKPRGSLGRLEELACRVAGMTRCLKPTVNRGVVFVMVGDHGVVEEGVSPYPQAVTAQMLGMLGRGRAAVNLLADIAGVEVVVVDVGSRADPTTLPAGVVVAKVASGTNNIARGPAMSWGQAVECVEVGIRLVQQQHKRGLDLAATGDMGIGNTTPSAAVAAALTGEPVEALAGPGSGLPAARLGHKCQVIKRSLEANRPNPSRPLDVLAKVGGFEIGAIAGVILGCAASRIPVVIDGFISGAAALLAARLAPAARDYMIAGHLSAEPGHALVLKHLGLEPLLRLEMRLGEGTGACLGMLLVKAALKLGAELPTFSEAGVSDREG